MKAEDRLDALDKHGDLVGQCTGCCGSYKWWAEEAIVLLRRVVADERESRGYAHGGLSDATLAEIEKYLEGGDASD